MTSLSSLIIGTAHAQTATPLQTSANGTNTNILFDFLQNSWVLIAIFFVFYFLVFKPQMQKATDQQRMQKALQVGDQVVTNGGLYGKVVRLDGDNDVVLEIANGVQIKLVKSFITNRIGAGK